MTKRLAPWLFAAALAACGGTDSKQHDDAPAWQMVLHGLPGALLSVWGTSARDVWTVGGDARDGTGPLVLHYDGEAWHRVPTGQPSGDLWWVHGFAGGPIYMGGAGGVILRYEGGRFTKMETPGQDTVFGLWGSSPDAMWAVGGEAGLTGFVWRLQGDAWVPEPSLPADVASNASIWKVFGRGPTDLRFIGSNGVSFGWDGTALVPVTSGVSTSLFTVHANEKRFVAVGGQVGGVIIEDDGDGWKTVLDSADHGLTGVCLGAGDTGFAVGQYGSVYARDADGWHEEEIGFPVSDDLHGVWVDPDGGVWAVGGQTLEEPLTDGLLLHRGDPVQAGGI
jgi:hypothetical protein